MSESPRTAVVLPAYDEEATIADTIRAFHAAVPDAAIYVVNNNSSDRTAALAAVALREAGCEGRVIHEPRQGKGNAVRRAFRVVDADIYVLSDADATYPAQSVKDLISPLLEDRADMVVGDRHTGGQYARQNNRPLHGFGNRLVRGLVNRLFRSNLADIMSGYRAFTREFVKNYPVLVEGFQIETDMTLHALDKRFRVLEVPIDYRGRPAGSVSKVNTLPDGVRIIFTIFQILRYYRPMVFFGIAASLFMAAGLVAGAPVLHEFVLTGFIKHIPLAILAAALEVVAVMLLGIGLILDSLARQQRMDYERELLSQNVRTGS